MDIGAFKKTSLIEVPDYISSIVFVNGCNFECPYCHVSFLWSNKTTIPEKEIFDFLEKRKNQIEFVAITGGEPTLQPDLKEFIIKIKKLGYKVSLETNGSNPQVIEVLLNNNLLDYIAMDIKTDKENYKKFFPKTEKIEKSVNLIKNSKINYEFRTTMVPEFTKSFEKIVSWIAGAENYYLQQFIPENSADENFKKILPYTEKQLNSFLETAKKYVKHCEIRSY